MTGRSRASTSGPIELPVTAPAEEASEQQEWLAAGLTLLVLFALLSAVQFHRQYPTALDARITSALRPWYAVYRFSTALHLVTPLWLSLGAAVGWLHQAVQKRPAGRALAFGLVTTLSQAMAEWVLKPLVAAGTGTFPSVHVAGWTAGATCTWLLWGRHVRTAAWRRLAAAGLVAVVAGMSVAVVAAFWHDAFDSAGGLLWGAGGTLVGLGAVPARHLSRPAVRSGPAHVG